MSEKQQHTAARMREQMENRYGDGLKHKHNKLHISFRQHCRSHPIQITNGVDLNIDVSARKIDVNRSTGLIHDSNLRKIRKRLDKGRIH